MVECIFTVDYEIFGNGQGALHEQIYEPAERLRALFTATGVRCVFFVEASELERISREGTDEAIQEIEGQVKWLYADGFEIGLHIHPQWYNAKFRGNRWCLDFAEYNLGSLTPGRIEDIVTTAIAYLRRIIGTPAFTPISFRAGNWLLQPTAAIGESLVKNGIKIDSSVYKGGRQRHLGLDYRGAMKNGYFWKFSDDVNVTDPTGSLFEFPTYVKMVPPWRMATKKRIEAQSRSPRFSRSTANLLEGIADRLRFRYPMKLDFSRLELKEIVRMVEDELSVDKGDPSRWRPIVAIGHTKDLFETETLEAMMAYLAKARVRVSTFQDILPRLSVSDPGP